VFEIVWDFMQDEFRTGLLQARSAFAKPLANSSAFDMQSLTEQMSNLRQQLCDFTMHEETPVESILSSHSMENVFNEVYLILRTAPPEAVANTLTFVRDAHRYPHPFRDDFQKHLAVSDVWESLQMLLRAPNFCLRNSAIYTIGKLTCKDRSHLLSDAFPFYLANDPINLPNLLFELLWLTNEMNWSFIEQISTSSHYLKRWSLCQVLDESGDSTETLNRFDIILARLKTDPHPLIAAEAAFRFERVRAKLGPKLPKAEWRKEVKRISSLEPRISFFFTANQFMRDRSDYSLDDFDRFVASLV